MTATPTTFGPQPSHPLLGTKVTHRFGGQDITFTVGEVVIDANGRTLARSTSDADHVWTRLWSTVA